MVKVTFIHSDGREETVDGRVGDSVMATALANDVEGIVGECGGSMMCATCHCYVDDGWSERSGDRMDGEEDMLDCAASELRPTSRLSCQIKLSEGLSGLVVYLPEAQL
ncbi:2Fe-2S iron-sulfur cluster-binding protein [Paracoccus aestuariivivens]|uniref:2Fe-2S iron-sulfur cluster binding domain-containing protein n=1 Tax=Paracoccus aestuariivivens TaxID=1820333 RepID=A0A6L6JIA1_9RHOB|nr:2Fe-2S iron-sulfur cluster-binding protein [Paracoccus aestuariivivens]MTH79611.1 2Fe-2S iron-sulfur cluster binding domain-containing protein [Paracoccus aestuariivivens]